MKTQVLLIQDRKNLLTSKAIQYTVTTILFFIGDGI